MFMHLKNRLARFRDATHGTVTVEAVIIVPILFWAVAATAEFFEMYRYKSIREKASYTVVDMISREQSSLSQTYIDNTKTLFDDFTNSDTEDQIRISVVTYNEDDDEYAIVWSEVRQDFGHRLGLVARRDTAHPHPAAHAPPEARLPPSATRVCPRPHTQHEPV